MSDSRPPSTSPFEVQIPGDQNSGPDSLPTLNEAELQWDELDCVLADLDDFVQVIEISGRDAQGKAAAPLSIVQGRDQLVSGELSSLQVTYNFADRTWIDTLLRQPGGARLVRIPTDHR